MPLPDLIEIVPLERPVRAEITVPGSKSVTNRALVLAALADGAVTLKGALWSEDTQVMVECLRRLGFDVDVQPDPAEFCNRTITVQGRGGRIPKAGTAESPLELFVGNAGTAARFLAAMVCLGNGVYRLSGVPRMHERPQAALVAALRELGYRVDSPNDKLPVVILGRISRGDEARSEIRNPKSEIRNSDPDRSGLTSAATSEQGRSCTVSIAESSQFASALLLSAKVGGWGVKVVGENAEESPYVAMTTELIKAFPHQGGEFQIEPDASSGSYFLGAGWLAYRIEFCHFYKSKHYEKIEWGQYCSQIGVQNWPKSQLQIDEAFPIIFFNCVGVARSEISRSHSLGDSIMTAVVLAPIGEYALKMDSVLAGAGHSLRFTDLGRLRLQECERVVALRTELTKCGAKVIEEGDTLTVYPSKLHGATIETYNDHRMAMCFAILGLKVPGIKIQNPACVKKTFPNFFQKLASPPPHGLGVEIRDGHTGRRLSADELFAE